MNYFVEYDEKAIKALRKMNKYQRKLLIKWIDTHLNGSKTIVLSIVSPIIYSL